MARRLKIGFDQGPYTLDAQTGKYGLLKPQATTLTRGTGTVVPGVRVWVPGHYIDTLGGTIRAASIVSGLSGVVIRKGWNTLEPTDFNYTLSSIGVQLDLCAGYGLYLYVMIEGHSFSKTTNYAPPRLVPYSNQYTSSTDPTKGGWTMWRANTVVNAAFQPLVQAIGTYISTHVNKVWFAGIATQETATQGQATDPTYTAANYITALCNESDYITDACLTGRGFHYVNQIAGNGSGNLLPTYSAKVRANGGVWGFPDLVMGNAGIHSNVYPWVLATHNAGGATFGCIQPAEYTPKPPADSRTMETLYQYGVGNTAFPDNFGDNQIHNDIFVWSDFNSGAQKYQPDAVTAIQAHPPIFGTCTPINP